MKVPLSWIKDFVEINLPIEELANLLTMTGLEVEEIRLVGLGLDYPVSKSGQPAENKGHEFKVSGLTWSADKFVVAQVEEVVSHPNADRLVLCRLNDGSQEVTVLTGAPNLFEYKGKGALKEPLKVAYACEGAQLFDGHQPGEVLTTLERKRIRGVESFSMICSEKELGISEEHEGIIVLDSDAPIGMSLQEYMGDAVFEIKISPNMIRNACMLGVAREIAAVTRKLLHKSESKLPAKGASVKDCVSIQIADPNLNPRFVLGLVRNTKPQTSPYWVQRRLKLAGMRPINSIVDATNYVMLEVGQPLHAFDYDVLVKRVKGKSPTIITRPAKAKEKLTTLDRLERKLDDFTILVTDTVGALSLAGVMGGMESEVTENTKNVLLEGATWNLTNIRRTVTAQRLPSEAAFRFSRGIHPELAKIGVQLGMDRMAQWSGGQVAADLVDAYPKPYIDPKITITPADVERLLGIHLSIKEIVDLLNRLEFVCKIEGDAVLAQTPPHRTDIGEGVIGKADLMEELVRLYGYDKIPATRMADELPSQRRNRLVEFQEQIQDALVRLGLQEVITYRLTAPEQAMRLVPSGSDCQQPKYIEIQNPIAVERRVMRHSLLESVLEVLEKNARLMERLALFEIGPVFIPQEGKELPDEPLWLAMAITGLRYPAAWDQKQNPWMDFFDLKGIVEQLLGLIKIHKYKIVPAEHISFHPGKTAQLVIGEKIIGTFGELHPLVKANYDFPDTTILAAKFDLQALFIALPETYTIQAIPTFPPVLEDIAVIVVEKTTAEKVSDCILQAGGALLSQVNLFDVFHSEQIGTGKKSLAYHLTYQAQNRTLTDEEVGRIRGEIIRTLEHELNAQIRMT